jgi:putative membrane protein
MKKYYFLLLLFFLGLAWAGINPRNYGHWIGEAAAPVVGLIILTATFKRFRYTIITYSDSCRARNLIRNTFPLGQIK